MKQRTKFLIRSLVAILVIVCAAAFVPWDMAWAWLMPLPDTIQQQADQALGYDIDGIIVYVDQAGKPPAYYAAGWKNKEHKVHADPQALFKIGSISKLYIAVAAAKLINSGKLSPDDTLARLLPALAHRIEHADQITLKMLLKHRSGIPDWIKDPGFPWGKPPADADTVLELVLDEPSAFTPDSRYAYSNTNYLLIGKILDTTLGYSHQLYIKNEILTPLGLTHTFGSLSEADPGAIASGYDTHYEQDVKMLDFVSPGGSMVATASDVGIFLRALNDGSLLTEEEQAMYSSVYEYEHTGLLPGYQSIARYHPEIDAVVIQFVNTSGGNAWTISEIVYQRIIRILSR